MKFDIGGKLAHLSISGPPYWYWDVVHFRIFGYGMMISTEPKDSTFMSIGHKNVYYWRGLKFRFLKRGW